MKKVCIDTDILGWFVKKEASDIQKANIEKSEFLFKWFEEKKINVVIPSIVVAETLSNVLEEFKREEICDYINDNFEVLQFDIISARIFAEIQIGKAKKREALSEYRAKNEVPKCKMKNDWNIASIALSNNCDAIFSNNKKDFVKFLEKDIIPIFDLEFVDSKKAEIAEKERLEKEAFEAEEAKKKEVLEGKLFPENLNAFETAEQARIKKEEIEKSAKDNVKKASKNGREEE